MKPDARSDHVRVAEEAENSPDFWAWLAANTPRLQSGGRNSFSTFTNEISDEFERCIPELCWEVIHNDSAPWVFCVSANGDRELFAKVRSAVIMAPVIPGWEIRAFRQRGSRDVAIEMYGRTLRYEDIWCEVEPHGNKACVTLLIRDLTSESAAELRGAAIVLLDNAVGEHDAVVKIVDLDDGPLPANPVRSETLFPLTELPAYLDRLPR